MSDLNPTYLPTRRDRGNATEYANTRYSIGALPKLEEAPSRVRIGRVLFFALAVVSALAFFLY